MMFSDLIVVCLRIVFFVYRWLTYGYDILFEKKLCSSKIPRHLAIGIKAPDVASPKQIAKLARFAREFGIAELTIYNTCSAALAVDKLSVQIGTNTLIVSDDNPLYIGADGTVTSVDSFPVSNEFVLRLIPSDYELKSGLKDFMLSAPGPNQAIRGKWQMQINGSPDLVLICGGAIAFTSICLSGFPSWLLRTAELGSLPVLNAVCKQHIQKQLVIYSNSTQRFGH